MTDIKIDLAEGCDSVLNLLGKQLDNGNCKSIIRADIGYFHQSEQHGPAGLRRGPQYRLSDDELLLVFQGIVCCLPTVKTLVVMSYFRADAMSLPVAALEMLFRRADRLEILFLHQIKLHGTAQQFSIMARSLKRHPALKRVNLHCCGDGNVERSSSLDPLVCALAQLPTLYYLSLDQVPISKASVEALSKSRSLKDVSFYNMPQLKSSLSILFEELAKKKSTSTLRGLRIRSCNLTETEADNVAKMIETNKSLESLVFYVDEWDDYGTPLAFALVQNSFLKRLEVGIGKISVAPEATPPDEGEGCTAGLRTSSEELRHKSAANILVQALESNKSSALRHFCMCLSEAKSTDLQEAYMGPLERMLENNYTLEHLLLQGKDSFSVVNPKVEFLLRLNQRSVLDRQKLFRDVVQLGNSPEPWVESIVRHREDLSILYYLLGKNPNLVDSMVAVPADGVEPPLSDDLQ